MPHRYWRVLANTSQSGADWIGADTIALYNAAGVNLATVQANASASGVYGGSVAANAIAGVPGEWVAGNFPPQWWAYDLGAAPDDIVRVDWTEVAASIKNCAKNAVVQWSDTSATGPWTTAFSSIFVYAGSALTATITSSDPPPVNPLSLSNSPTFSATGAKFAGAMTGGVGTTPINFLPTTGGFTAEGWFNFSGGSGVFLVFGSVDTFWVGINNGQISAHFGLGTTEGVITGTTSVPTGVWHHVALVCGATGTSLYLDGAVAGSSALTFSGQGATFANPIGIRAFNGFAYGQYMWPGGISEVAFWPGSRYTTAFTPQTAAYLGSETGLIALYHLTADGTDSRTSATASAMYAPTVSGLVVGGSTTISGLYGGPAPTSVTYSLDSGAAVAATAPTIGSGSYSFVITTPAAGAHSITVTGTGANTSTSPATAFTTATAGLNAPSVTGLVVGGSTTLSGTYGGAAPTSVTYSLDSGAAVAATAPTIGSGTYSFVITTPASGAHTITVTGTGANTGTSPATSFTTSGTAIAAGNAAFVYSPYNWQVVANKATTWNAGAYFRVLFSGATCVLNFDVSVAVSPFSQIWWRIDNGPWVMAPVAASITCIVPTITAGNADVPYHRLDVAVKGMCNEVATNRWLSPVAGAVRFVGLILDTGASVLSTGKATLNILVYGDSITEGNRTLGETGNTPDVNDALQGWAFSLGALLGAEIGVVGFGGTGYSTTYGGVPIFQSTFNLLSPGVARSFTPAPDLVVINHGINDQATNIQAAAITAINGLLAVVACKVVLLNPLPAGSDNQYLKAAVAGCSQPARAVFISSVGYFDKTKGADGYQLHPSGPNNTALIAPKVAAALRLVLAGTVAAVSRWTHS